ncbi:MAG: hypothetical protein ACREB8_03380 [Pseudolabrys sp.]
MSLRNSVIIVASPRPRVGKTLLARLLTDFHLQEGRAVAAFDVNAGERALAQFLPEHVTRSTIDDIKGQMALFDRLIAEDGTDKIVDLGHASFESFFTLAGQIGFVEEARNRGIAPAVLYLLTPDRASVEAYSSLQSRLPGAVLVPVHNEILSSAQFRHKYGVLGLETVVVRLTQLAPGLRKYVETPPFSFAQSRLAAGADTPDEVNNELQHWLRRNYLEFREIDLRILLRDLKSSFRL